MSGWKRDNSDKQTQENLGGLASNFASSVALSLLLISVLFAETISLTICDGNKPKSMTDDVDISEIEGCKQRQKEMEAEDAMAKSRTSRLRPAFWASGLRRSSSVCLRMKIHG